MNLADPTVGDIIDRLSILSMKVGSDDGAISERAALMGKLKTTLAMKTPDAQAELVYAVAALGAVNGRLWEMHERPEGLPLTGAMALNRMRRWLVEQIR